MIRVNEFDKVASTPLDEWIEYLKDGTIRPDTTVPGLREAREKLKYDSMTRGERYAYEEHLTNVVILEDAIENAKWEGLTEGKAEGLAEGETKAMRQAATNMKQMGMDAVAISNCTGLTADEIEKL